MPATSSDNLSLFGDRASQLYSLPAAAVQVLELTEEPDVDIPELKRTIETDPALTVKILRVVNSSLFARSGEVGDLGQALALLGIQPLKMLVLGFSLPHELFVEQDGDVLERYWRRSLIKAVAAKEIAKRFWHVPADELFITGLLDDLGQLVLLQQLGEKYLSLLMRADFDVGSLERQELATLGFTHRQLTAELLRRWRLPKAIVRGIDFPRDADGLLVLSPEAGRVPQVMHLAELTADVLMNDNTSNVDELIGLAHAYRGIVRREVMELVDAVQELLDPLAQAIGVHVGDSCTYSEIASVAHVRLAAVAENAVSDVVRYHRLSERGDLEEEVWEEATALGECLTNMLKWSIADAVSPSTETDETEVTAANPPDSAGDELSSANTVSEGSAAVPANALSSIASPATTAEEAVTSRLAIDEEVALAVRLCRAKMWSLSVLLIEVGEIGDSTTGPQCEAVLSACRLAPVEYGKICFLRANCFVWIVPDCDTHVAVNLAREILVDAEAQRPPASVAVGVASVSAPAKNFDSQTLVHSAERCLYGVRSSGGSGVKSISVF